MPTLNDAALKVGASFVDAAYMGSSKVYDGLPPQVRAIFADPALECHLYMPGVGMMSGFQSGNYEDSVGAINVSVDGLVGLELDAAGSVGPELVTNGGPFANTIGWASNNGGTVSVESGKLKITSAGATYGGTVGSFATVSGETYRVKYRANYGTSNQAWLLVGSSYGGNQHATIILGAMASDQEYVFKAAGPTSYLTLQNNNAVSGGTMFVELIGCKQITGIHATQATTGNKPRLRQSNGKYFHEFDGTDYLSLGAPLFQMSDDHFVAVGASQASANWSIVADLASNSVLNGRCCELGFSDQRRACAQWVDSVGVAASWYSPDPIPLNAPVVISGGKTGNFRTAELNGVQFGSGTLAMAATTTNAGYIGVERAAGAQHRGAIYPLVAIKGTVSEQNRQVIRKFVASLAGVTL